MSIIIYTKLFSIESGGYSGGKKKSTKPELSKLEMKKLLYEHGLDKKYKVSDDIGLSIRESLVKKFPGQPCSISAKLVNDSHIAILDGRYYPETGKFSWMNTYLHG